MINDVYRKTNQYLRRVYFSFHPKQSLDISARRERIRQRAMNRNSRVCWYLLKKIDWMTGNGYYYTIDPEWEEFMWEFSKYARNDPKGRELFYASEKE